MEDSNKELSTIWKQQKISTLNIDELLDKYNRFRSISIRKLIITNVILILTCLFVIFIWNYYNPQLITTKIALSLTIFIMFILVFFNNKQFFILKKLDITKSNNEYLQSLTALKIRQKYMQKRILSIYFIVLSLSICMYLYEFTIKMNFFLAILTYFITLSWIGFNWFYLRPKVIHQQQSKLDNLIQKFETVNEQFK